MTRAAALAALALALLPASASAVALRAPDGTTPQPYQTWADAALAPTPPGEVALVNDHCPGEPTWGACYAPSLNTIYLSGQQAGNRAQFLHELGHAFDAIAMTDPYRAGFRKIMREPRDWWDTDPDGDGSPGERFATAYSVCARRREIARDGYLYGPGYGYGYRPTATQHRRVCALIHRAAGA